MSTWAKGWLWLIVGMACQAMVAHLVRLDCEAILDCSTYQPGALWWLFVVPGIAIGIFLRGMASRWGPALLAAATGIGALLPPLVLSIEYSMEDSWRGWGRDLWGMSAVIQAVAAGLIAAAATGMVAGGIRWVSRRSA